MSIKIITILSKKNLSNFWGRNNFRFFPVERFTIAFVQSQSYLLRCCMRVCVFQKSSIFFMSFCYIFGNTMSLMGVLLFDHVLFPHRVLCRLRVLFTRRVLLLVFRQLPMLYDHWRVMTKQIWCHFHAVIRFFKIITGLSDLLQDYQWPMFRLEWV